VNDADAAIAAIDGFSNLNFKGWDSYGADPIAPETIAKAKGIVEGLRGLDCLHFNPAPCGDGTIGFEICWKDGRELWIDVGTDGTLQVHIPKCALWING
jgi:hypothetical protein